MIQTFLNFWKAIKTEIFKFFIISNKTIGAMIKITCKMLSSKFTSKAIIKYKIKTIPALYNLIL